MTMIVTNGEYGDMVQAQYSSRPGGHADFHCFVRKLAVAEWYDFEYMMVGNPDGHVAIQAKALAEEAESEGVEETLREALRFMAERANRRAQSASGHDYTAELVFANLSTTYCNLVSGLSEKEVA